MTQRLFEMGKRILEHNRRLTLLPQQPGLPPAYAMLLLDPADLLADAWGALFSAQDAATSEAMPAAERRDGYDWTRQFPPGDTTSASHLYDSHAASAPYKREAVRLQPTSTPSAPARTEWPVKSQRPLSLVSLTSKHFTSGTQQRDAFNEKAKSDSWPSTKRYQRAALPFEESSKSNSRTEPETSLTTPARSDMPPDSSLPPHANPLPANLTGAESSNAFLPNAALRPAPTTPNPDAQTRAAVSPVKLFGDREAILPPPASTIRASATQQPEEAHLPGVNFTPSPSRLADMLNANLTDDRNATAHDSGFEAIGAAQRADAPSNSFQARDGNSFATRHGSSFDSSDAREHGGWEKPPEHDGSTQGRDAPLVEAVLEELYERLRLEFLRTYGTSGE